MDGEVLFHGQDLLKLSEEELRHVRGNRIAMIFQRSDDVAQPGVDGGAADHRGTGIAPRCHANRAVSA